MEIIIKITQFILCFSLLVFVHEGGHFMFAKLFKIRVEKFYLFFNPWFSLFKFKYKGTEYGMGWVPIGGYVSISGMIDETKDATQLASEPQPYEFRSKPAWQRLLVMLGGVMMNIITAIIIYTFLSYSYGSSYIKNSDVVDGLAYTETAKGIGFQDGDKLVSVNGESFDNYLRYREAIIIGSAPLVEVLRDGKSVKIQIKDSDVSKLLENQIIYNLRIPMAVNSIVADDVLDHAGIKVGDSIIALNNTPITYFDEFLTIVSGSPSKAVEFIVARAKTGVIDTLNVIPSKDGLVGLGINVTSIPSIYKVTSISYTLLESVPEGLNRAWRMSSSYVKQFKLIFNPDTKAYKSVGSVLTMGDLFTPVWDWGSFWNLTAVFSVILAVMNLLPIPALDGGHVLFLLVEVITGRKPSDNFLEKAQTIGFYLLMALMVLAMSNDIQKFFF